MSIEKLTLTPHQQETYDYILSCVNDACNDTRFCTRMVCLNGPAGSGKTTLTSKLIHNLNKKYKIAITATTHKALGVLKDMVGNSGITTKTIHSHLLLKLQIDFNTGKTFLTPAKGNSTPQKTQILFVDESSMCSDELFHHINNYINSGGCKIVIFVGDKFQLPPIEESNENLVYKLNFQYDLKEVVRQASDNPIIQLATSIRTCIETKEFLSQMALVESLNSFVDNKRIIAVKNRPEMMAIYFKEEYKDKKKFICVFTNDAATGYNTFCRAKIKGFDIPQFIPGDEIVFTEVHVDALGDPIHTNNEIVTIESVVLDEYTEYYEPIMYWKCVDTDGKTFNVIEKSCESLWNKYLKDKASFAKSEKDQKTRVTLWQDYYSTKQLMSSVSFTYSGTIHKSQGSSYDITFVDVAEVLRFWRPENVELLFRLLYVGCTRPKETLVMIFPDWFYR